MDPLNLIVDACIIGVSAGSAETAKSMVVDAYRSFKSYLLKRIEGSEDAQKALADVEKRPDSRGRKATLMEELENLGLKNDTELIALAQRLSEISRQDKDFPGNNIIIHDSPGTIIRNEGKITQRFDLNKKSE